VVEEHRQEDERLAIAADGVGDVGAIRSGDILDGRDLYTGNSSHESTFWTAIMDVFT
jgi:hypothetical protein